MLASRSSPSALVHPQTLASASLLGSPRALELTVCVRIGRTQPFTGLLYLKGGVEGRPNNISDDFTSLKGKRVGVSLPPPCSVLSRAVTL